MVPVTAEEYYSGCLQMKVVSSPTHSLHEYCGGQTYTSECMLSSLQLMKSPWAKYTAPAHLLKALAVQLLVYSTACGTLSPHIPPHAC